MRDIRAGSLPVVLSVVSSILLVGFVYVTTNGGISTLLSLSSFLGVPFLLLLTMSRPLWLFPLAGALAPIVYAISLFGAKVTPADIVVGGIILSFVMARPRPNLSGDAVRIVVPFIVLLGISLVSLSVSGNPQFGVVKIVQRMEFLLVFCAAAALLRDPVVIRRTILAYLATSTVLSVLVLWLTFANGLANGPIDILFLNKNSAGSFLAISIPLLISLYIMGSPKYRKYAMALACLGTVALILTGSRGAWIGVLVALGVMLIRRGGKGLLVYGATAIVMLVMVATILPASLTRANDFSGSTNNLGHGAASDTVLVREVIWRDALNLIAAHPLLGMGVGGYISYDTYQGDPINFNTIDPHNAILYMWAELGPFGLVAFLWLLWTIFSLAFRSANDAKESQDYWISEGCLAALISYMVFTLTEPIWVRGDGLIFFLLVGICANLGSQLSSESYRVPQPGSDRPTAFAV